MHCKFLEHGLAISYDGAVKPCCEWTYTNSDHVNSVDLVNWHQSPAILHARDQLAQGHWPNSCTRCQHYEDQGRQDSMRGNGNQSLVDYAPTDITLEIRPGSVCNFACQSCWPEASSRVAQFYHQAKRIDINTVHSEAIVDFAWIQPIKHRVRSVVLLGGEPFYDPNCRKFLHWAQQNLTAEITMFTNGSKVDWDWVDQYAGRICLVFSIDAVGTSAEYIRFGTDWPVVMANYQQALKHPKIDVRVNVTTSVFNYYELADVVQLLAQQWPSKVTFGHPKHSWMRDASVPAAMRPELILKLNHAIKTVFQLNIDADQKTNATRALYSIVNNLRAHTFDPNDFDTLKKFVQDMDQVKHCRVQDHCEFLSQMLELGQSVKIAHVVA